MSKWTKGPWKVGTRTPTKVLDPGAIPVAQAFDAGGSGETALANARLIAAAPEMAAWINDVLGLIEGADLYPNACEQARALLARIEGD